MATATHEPRPALDHLTFYPQVVLYAPGPHGPIRSYGVAARPHPLPGPAADERLYEFATLDQPTKAYLTVHVVNETAPRARSDLVWDLVTEYQRFLGLGDAGDPRFVVAYSRWNGAYATSYTVIFPHHHFTTNAEQQQQVQAFLQQHPRYGHLVDTAPYGKKQCVRAVVWPRVGTGPVDVLLPATAANAAVITRVTMRSTALPLPEKAA